MIGFSKKRCPYCRKRLFVHQDGWEGAPERLECRHCPIIGTLWERPGRGHKWQWVGDWALDQIERLKQLSRASIEEDNYA